MSLGENLQFIRKKNNVTQEQFAEQLGVSRQSISKWESDASYPEMEKLLWICDHYHCELDTLMRGSMENTSVEDTAKYDHHMNGHSRNIALGVALTIFGVATENLLEGLLVPEYLCTAVMFLIIAAAVMIFVITGLQYDSFQKRFPYIEQFYTQDQIYSFDRKYPLMIAIPIAIIFGAFVIVSISEQLMVQTGWEEGIFNGTFLYLISIAVGIIVYACLQKSKYDIKAYNKEVNPDHETKKQNSRIGKWTAIATGYISSLLFIIFLWKKKLYHMRVTEMLLTIAYPASMVLLFWGNIIIAGHNLPFEEFNSAFIGCFVILVILALTGEAYLLIRELEMERLRIKQREYEYYKKEQQQHYTSVAERKKSIAKIKHDLHNEVIACQYLKEQGRDEEVQDRIQQIQKKLEDYRRS